MRRRTSALLAANAPASDSDEGVELTAVNGIPIAGHQGQGSIADTTVRKLLMLQGLTRPRQIVSLMSYPGAVGALTSPARGGRDPRQLRRGRCGSSAHGRRVGLGSRAGGVDQADRTAR